MNKKLRHIAGAILVLLIGYHSVYFMPLDKKLSDEIKVKFDVEAFVDALWPNQIIDAFNSSIQFDTLIEQLAQAPEQTFEKEGQALGIGNIRYFKVMGTGTVQTINENNVMLRVGDRLVEIETEFIFGNAVRDASGLIRINDFDETSDFNSISEEINARIRKEVIPDFRAGLQKNDKVTFSGAIMLNKAHLNLELLEVIPISLETNQ